MTIASANIPDMESLLCSDAPAKAICRNSPGKFLKSTVLRLTTSGTSCSDNT
jgi:hypothetical protein